MKISYDIWESKRKLREEQKVQFELSDDGFSQRPYGAVTNYLFYYCKRITSEKTLRKVSGKETKPFLVIEGSPDLMKASTIHSTKVFR